MNSFFIILTVLIIIGWLSLFLFPPISKSMTYQEFRSRAKHKKKITIYPKSKRLSYRTYNKDVINDPKLYK